MQHDVVIVGAGPAGMSLALELSGHGLRTALIESSGEDFDPDTQALHDGEVTGNDRVDLMALNPLDGVVDADCRVHGTRNLYVASGSVMPSAGHANPTLTIIALSIRLADHLKERMASL